MNDWAKHVTAYAKKHDISLKEAMQSKKCKESYQRKKRRSMRKTSPERDMNMHRLKGMFRKPKIRLVGEGFTPEQQAELDRYQFVVDTDEFVNVTYVPDEALPPIPKRRKPKPKPRSSVRSSAPPPPPPPPPPSGASSTGGSGLRPVAGSPEALLMEAIRNANLGGLRHVEVEEGSTEEQISPELALARAAAEQRTNLRRTGRNLTRSPLSLNKPKKQ